MSIDIIHIIIFLIRHTFINNEDNSVVLDKIGQHFALDLHLTDHENPLDDEVKLVV